jgi:HD-GYP domain-containing protein (c-di-GMP phosphodiesterase class II)
VAKVAIPDGVLLKPGALTAAERRSSRPTVAIADVFDAITSDRVYRPAMPLERAVWALREGRGTQFDPVLLDHFLEDLAEAGADTGLHAESDG